ncbi:MAG: sodium-dependent transporter, partial [Bacteroidaceae bacterium]|nr:sodium-dependent transporter [Bacteroidaceae bacterium]
MANDINQNGFASKLGAILAAAGSAVGLGNVWRFPTETGANGGAAFILIYVLFMLLLGLPVMVSEFVIGRYSQKNVSESFLMMSGGKKVWSYMGLIPMIAAFLVLSYYAVVSGWTLYYAVQAGMNGFAGKDPAQYAADFAAFSSDPVLPWICMTVILALTCGIVAMGVQKGIERGSKVMMPILFIFIVILVGCSLSLPNASLGLSFLLTPDFSKVTGSTVLSAMGQAFFSLSVGLCCLCTYACYFRRDVNLIKDGATVCIIDTLVALCSGLIIFPAVYSIPGLTPDAGPSLVFITLPNVFQQVFGGIPVLAYVFSLMFYLLLVMAALTSSISMLEMGAAFFEQKFHVRRWKCAVGVTLVCVVLGTACSLSFGIWSDIKIFGMGFFDLFDYLVAKFIMPIGSLLITFFVGWVVDRKIV